MNYAISLLVIAVLIGILTIVAALRGQSRTAVTALIVVGLLTALGGVVEYNKPEPATVIVNPTPTPRELEPSLRESISRYASLAGPHKILVMSVSDPATLLYADSIAIAFRSGGWTIDGLGPNGLGVGGHVLHRLGELPEDPHLAITGNDATLVRGVRSQFEQHQITTTAAWPTDGKEPYDDPVSIFIGKELHL